MAEDAFSRGYYGLVYEGSALNYADVILSIDPSNTFALEMRERIRKTAHQSGQTAIAKSDLAQAQQIFSFLTEYIPRTRKHASPPPRSRASYPTVEENYAG